MTPQKRPRAKLALLITDLDGTLVPPDKTLTPRTIAAAKALDDAGIALALTSSRPPYGMRMFVEPLNVRTPLGAINGGFLVRPDLTTIEERVLPGTVARSAIGLLEQFGLDVWVYTRDSWLVRNCDTPRISDEERTLQFPPTVVADFDSVLDCADKIVGIGLDGERLARCAREAEAKLAGRANALLSQSCYLDITHPDANKGRAVRLFSEMLSVPRDAIASIGDGFNDIPMFRESALSIAMGNAHPEVQREADIVTGPNTEDGFAEAVERYVLAAQPAEGR